MNVISTTGLASVSFLSTLLNTRFFCADTFQRVNYVKGSAVINKVEMPGSRNERQASSQKGGRGRGGGRAKIVGWCIMVILPFLFLFVPFILHQATVETASASLPGDMSSIGLKSRIAKLKQRQDAIDGMLRQHSERDSILSGGARRLPSTGPASLDRLDGGSPTTSASSRDWREKSSDSSTSACSSARHVFLGLRMLLPWCSAVR